MLSFFNSGSHLLSRAVSSKVPSAAWVLTIVFGMGTGVTPRRIATGKIRYLKFCLLLSAELRSTLNSASGFIKCSRIDNSTVTILY